MVNELGRELSRHRGTFSQGGTAWLLGFALLPAMVMGPLAIISVFFEREAGALDAWQMVCFGVFAMMLSPAILALPILRWRQSVVVYEHGLVHQNLLGTKTLRAGDVTRVQHTLIHRKYSNLDEIVIHRAGERGHFITGIGEAKHLANIVHAWTSQARALSPAAQPPAAQPPAAQPPVAGGWVPPAER